MFSGDVGIIFSVLVYRIPFLLCDVALLVAVIVGLRRTRWGVLTVMLIAVIFDLVLGMVSAALQAWNVLLQMRSLTMHYAREDLSEYLIYTVDYLGVAASTMVAVCLLVVVSRLVRPPQTIAPPQMLTPTPVY